MTFKDQMATDFASVNLNTNEFAEAITYKLGGTGGVAIDAVFIERDGNEVRDERGGGRSDQRYADLWIANDAVNGVLAPTSSDTITVTATSEDWSVNGPPQDDGGAWLLQLVRDVVLEDLTAPYYSDGP